MEGSVLLNLDCNKYRRHNPVLAKSTDQECTEHFLLHGEKRTDIPFWSSKKEDLFQKIINCLGTIPKEFDINQYKLVHRDIEKESDLYVVYHYLTSNGTFQHSYIEPLHEHKDVLFDREFFCKRYNVSNFRDAYQTYVEDIRLIKSQVVLDVIENISPTERDFVLVDHNSNINGASHSLFILANFLKSENKSIIILTPQTIGEVICNKYELKAEDFISYKEDPTILFWLCKNIQSPKIIMNSINGAMSHTMRWIERDRLVLFSREIKQDYMRLSCYEPDIVITKLISDTYDSLPLIQTPICPQFLQSRIYSDYEEEVHFKEMDITKVTIGMCGSLTERKNFRMFLEVAELLPDYNFIWIGGEKMDTTLQNVYHITDTATPFKYYKLIDYFVLFSECEPFGNVVVENLLLNKKVLGFRDNVWFDFKDELTKYNYFEFQGKITTENAINHILNIATRKQSHEKYMDAPSNLYVRENFSEYTLSFQQLLNSSKQYINNTKQLTNKRNVFVKCRSGFCNQLRLMLAGSFLVTNGFIDSYNQEWILNEQNNVDFLSYFEPLPGVTLTQVEEGERVSFNNVIHTTGFTGMINLFTNQTVSPAAAILQISSKLVPKFKVREIVSKYNLSNALGIHVRRTDKALLYSEETVTQLDEQLVKDCEYYDRVYLATDNPQTQDLFKKRLGEKLLFHSDISKSTLGGSIRHTTADHTVGDFMLLQQCQKFVGTDMSSFSTLIKYIRNTSQDRKFIENL